VCGSVVVWVACASCFWARFPLKPGHFHSSKLRDRVSTITLKKLASAILLSIICGIEHGQS
jgi:hypothetical protein